MADQMMATVEAAPGYAVIEDVIVKGDLAKLSPEQRSTYYMAVCQSVGLNPLTKPFEYIVLNGKLTLYALKGATDQLRSIHGINIIDTKTEYIDELIVVTVAGEDRSGRRDSEIGAVTIGGLRGDAKANALMKALTKAKRRLTLSMCGLGMLDESELETIPAARAYAEPRGTVQAIAATDAGEEPVSERTMSALHAYTAQQFGWTHDDLRAVACFEHDVTSMRDLTEPQGRGLLRMVNGMDLDEAASALSTAVSARHG